MSSIHIGHIMTIWNNVLSCLNIIELLISSPILKWIDVLLHPNAHIDFMTISKEMLLHNFF